MADGDDGLAIGVLSQRFSGVRLVSTGILMLGVPVGISGVLSPSGFWLFAALCKIGDEHGATPAQVALSWLIHFHGEAIVAIPGASRRSQAEENAAAMRVNLTAPELHRLDDVSRSCN